MNWCDSNVIPGVTCTCIFIYTIFIKKQSNLFLVQNHEKSVRRFLGKIVIWFIFKLYFIHLFIFNLVELLPRPFCSQLTMLNLPIDVIRTRTERHTRLLFFFINIKIYILHGNCHWKINLDFPFAILFTAFNPIFLGTISHLIWNFVWILLRYFWVFFLSSLCSRTLLAWVAYTHTSGDLLLFLR